MMLYLKIFVATFFLLVSNCDTTQTESPDNEKIIKNNLTSIEVGAARLDDYLSKLKGKTIGMVVNQTSMIGATHLVDSLLALGVNIKTIFAPEHGFRQMASAGEQIQDGKDDKTGLPILSLYGKKKKPSSKDLAGIDLIIFDIQDVGARFYTYISSMHYVMEACAENGVAFMVLDRPNPNGHYVDGMVLNPDYSSFVGMHPIPVVHGMTIGEYATMVNSEGWLKNGIRCELEVIKCRNYDHKTPYQLPIKPSPNLPNNRAIYLYPSLCFFEGTVVNAGRGTNKQFQVYGAPESTIGDFEYTPVSMSGAKYPKHQDQLCKGFDLSNLSEAQLLGEKQINLTYLIEFYQAYPDKANFFNNFFDKLAGGTDLREQIIAGKNATEIRESWQKDLNKFKAKRNKYLLY